MSLGSAPGEFYKTRLLPTEMLAEASRKDALPEHIQYNANTNCRAWKAGCLSCPFGDCIADGDGLKRFDGAVLRLKVTLALHPRQGMNAGQAAERIGINKRTVFKIAAENRAHVQSLDSKGVTMPVPAAWVLEQASKGTNRNVALLRQLRTPAEIHAEGQAWAKAHAPGAKRRTKKAALPAPIPAVA